MLAIVAVFFLRFWNRCKAIKHAGSEDKHHDNNDGASIKSQTPSEWHSKPAQRIWYFMFDTTTWFSLVITIVMLVYLKIKEDPEEETIAAFERKFLRFLAMFQLNALSVAFLSIFLAKAKQHWRFYGVPLLALVLQGFLLSKFFPEAKDPLFDLSKPCKAEGIRDYLFWFGLIAPAMVGIAIFIKLGVRMGFLDYKNMKERKSLAVVGIAEFVGFVGAVAVGGFTIGHWFEMKEHLGKDFEDSEWGFGQVASVAAWAPLAWMAIETGIGTLNGTLQRLISF